MLAIPTDHVLLGRKFASKREVIEAIGELMARCGDTAPDYTRAMLEKEDQYSTWIADGIALPHGTNASKASVIRNSLVIVPLPDAVDWGEGKLVRLAIGVAGAGNDEHIALLSQIAEVLRFPENVECLSKARDAAEAIRILTGREAA